jgi:hypothetical protein
MKKTAWQPEPRQSPLPQNRFAMNHPHAPSQKGLDNGSCSRGRLKPALFGFTCRMVCRTPNPAALTAGFHLLPAFETRYFVQPSLGMMGRMIAPFGAMMSRLYGRPSENGSEREFDWLDAYASLRA